MESLVGAAAPQCDVPLYGMIQTAVLSQAVLVILADGLLDQLKFLGYRRVRAVPRRRVGRLAPQHPPGVASRNV